MASGVGGQARTPKAVEQFRRFYLGDERVRAAVAAREVPRTSAGAGRARRLRRPWRGGHRPSGPAVAEVDGVRSARRIWCEPGSEAFTSTLRGMWVLSEDEPLVDGAPHYEKPLQYGREAHLYRTATGAAGKEKRLVVSPMVGAQACFAVANVGDEGDDVQPTEVVIPGERYWLVNNGHEWCMGDTGFRYIHMSDDFARMAAWKQRQLKRMYGL